MWRYAFLLSLYAASLLTSCGADPSNDDLSSVTGPVSAKGEKGDRGDKGDVGPMGPRGPAGTNGKDGKDGADGVDGKTIVEVPVPVNQWYDPLTARSWLIGVDVLFADAECGSDWRLPTRDELIDAKNHGLPLASADLDGPTDGWSSTVSGANRHWFIDFNSVHLNDGGDTDYHGLFCVKD